MIRCRIEVQKALMIWWYAQVFIEGESPSPRFWGRTSEASMVQAEEWVAQRHGPDGIPGELIGDEGSFAYYFAVSRSADSEGEALAPGEVA